LNYSATCGNAIKLGREPIASGIAESDSGLSIRFQGWQPVTGITPWNWKLSISLPD
jgi:hypothetical protein